VTGRTPGTAAERTPPRPLRLRNLLLVDPHGASPVTIDTLAMDGDGLSVARVRGDDARVLPWDEVGAHAVEHWPGGTVPEGWLSGSPGPEELPFVAAGVLISVQTAGGTYRFLRPGVDPAPVADRLEGFVIHRHGPSAASTVTRAAGRTARTAHPGVRGPVWRRLRPVVVIGACLLAAALITLVLLQSAGVIHVPFLGGPGGSGGTGSGPVPTSGPHGAG